MRRCWALPALAAFAVAAAGCGTQADKRILEELGMVSVIGFDEEEGQEADRRIDARTTVLFPVISPQAKVEEETLSVMSRSNDSRQRLSRMTDRKLVFGQLRSAIYNVRIAEGGLLDDLDALHRDPTLGTRVKLALSDSPVRELLAFRHPSIPLVGQYIDLLLEKEAIHLFIPRVNLHTFYRDLRDDGIDPVVPILNPSASSIMLDGIGLFRDDRLAGRIKADDIPYFIMLYGHFHQGLATVPLGREEIVTLGALRGDRQVRVRRTAGGAPAAEIRVTLNGSVVEYISDMDLKSQASRDAFVRRVARQVEENCRRQLRLMQRLRADCIGIGQHARALYSHAEWTKRDWRDTFADMDIRVKVEMRIKDYGVYP